MVRLLAPKHPPMSLNMRNSKMSPNAMTYLSQAMSNSNYYITALNLKFCFLTFDDILMLSKGIKFNKTIVTLDLGKNGLKSCVVKFFLESLLDNFTLAHLSLAGNFLDNEFAVDLGHLLEQNQILNTVDISANPIGPEGAKYLLQSILQHNDTLESLGDDLDQNMYMGVRIREEIKQILELNVKSHERKRRIMNQIEETKKQNPTPENINNVSDPSKKVKKLADD
mmetsp:Transcript_12756/g.21530  ORF Transcript_12756/g.21530 Transcript_12756/m.21530 type:complete len:225 (-) Transcript_12756:230-904(-)